MSSRFPFAPGPLAILSLIGVAALALGCGSNNGRLNLAEYAAFCAENITSAQTLIEPESIVWGDLLSLAEPSLERLRSVEPPEQLDEFHRASIRALDFVVGVALEQPADEVANPLVFGFEAIGIATRLSRATDDLPADLRMQLSEAGCL